MAKTWFQADFGVRFWYKTTVIDQVSDPSHWQIMEIHFTLLIDFASCCFTVRYFQCTTVNNYMYIFSYIITVYVHTHNPTIFMALWTLCTLYSVVGVMQLIMWVYLRQLRLVKHGFEFAQDCYETPCKDMTVVLLHSIISGIAIQSTDSVPTAHGKFWNFIGKFPGPVQSWKMTLDPESP